MPDLIGLARMDAAFSDFGKWPRPTSGEPSIDEMEEWSDDGGCEATDGCWVDPDGTCEHGHPSWMLRLGLI